MKKIYLLSVLFFALSTTAYAQEKAPEPEAEASDNSDDIRAELDALRKEVAELRHEVAEKEEGHESASENAHEEEDEHEGDEDGEHNEDEQDLHQEQHEDAKGEQSEDDHDKEDKRKWWIPRFTLMGDFYGQYAYHDGEIYSGENRTGVFFDNMEIELESELAKDVSAVITIDFSEEGVELETGYVIWRKITPWFGLAFGRFRQTFGRNNEIHSPEMNQFDRPIVIRQYFGDHGLIGDGLAATFLFPKHNSYTGKVEIEVTNGNNDTMFAGEFFSAPAGLVHLTNIWNVNKTTEVNFGLSGMLGTNNEWGAPPEPEPESVTVNLEPTDPTNDQSTEYEMTVVEEDDHDEEDHGEEKPVNDTDWRLSALAGADLTAEWRWGKDNEKSVMWRSEFIYAYKEEYNPEIAANDEIHAFGGYSYVQYRFIKNLAAGIRGDVAQPLVFDNKGKVTWGVSPYITWYQNSHLRLRLQYSYIDWAEGPEGGPGGHEGHSEFHNPVGAEHLALLQVTFSIGAHGLAGDTPQRIRGKGHGH
ncbi:MAG: hypothetical protein GY762_11980 [Proteobacteria bacterium]|nr:hypothetical protein [Pseudomonadota bacterium]